MLFRTYLLLGSYVHFAVSFFFLYCQLGGTEMTIGPTVVESMLPDSCRLL